MFPAESPAQWGGHSRAELREHTGELCPLSDSCCPAQACLHGKGTLEQTVRGFQCLLPFKYTSLSSYYFSKILILTSAPHSPVLCIEMGLLTCVPDHGKYEPWGK